eukprot:Phypoly_transcript_00181.p1 GENE.Phypoly_transcript_00181~~Phypoly_transcript_00181.p1  ORF type:complete len:2011 (+),score=311.30 Phypoly_transcript_00181:88-6120(+)
MEPVLPEVDLNFIERLIYTEVAVILAQHNVTDRGDLYNKITKSLWRGEASLQVAYERQIAKSKQDIVWSSIKESAIINDIQEHFISLVKAIKALFEKHKIVGSEDLFARAAQNIMSGNGAMFLQEEISQEEWEDIKREFEDIAGGGVYQLPSQLKPHQKIAPPPLDLDSIIPQVPKKTVAPPTLPTFPRESPPSIEWLQVFQRHSVLWKFLYSDFCKVSEWALFGYPTKQIARVIVDDCKDVPSFNRRLYSAFFFLIKRRLDLYPFVDALVECFLDFGVESEQYSLRMFVNLLLSNCDKLVRQKLMYLISASNPVPITEFVVTDNQTTFSQHFTPELYWILDDKFLFFSLGLGNCKGKSTLLNRIFGTTFETSKNSKFFRGTVDYQSDSTTIPERGVVVADGHGTMTNPVKQGLFAIADGVLLHVRNDVWNAERGLVREEIESAAQAGVRLIVVLVRDVNEPRNGGRVSSLENFFTLLSPQLGAGGDKPVVLIFKLPSLISDDMVDHYVRGMREKIMECIWTTFGISSPSLGKYKPAPVQMVVKKDKKEKFANLLSSTQKSKIAEARAVLVPILRASARAVQGNRVQDSSFLPVYPKFKAVQQLRNSLTTSRFGHAQEAQRWRVLIKNLTEEIRQTDIDHLPEAIQLFETIITARQSSLIEFVKSLRKIALDEEARSKGTNHSHANTQKSICEGKSLGIELFWREINQLYVLGRSCEKVSQALRSLVLDGEPFELIDGDNFYFPFRLLYYSLKSVTRGKRVLVVGAIGSQNSGKSTLLNFMFGCNLTYIEARVTKGVYGTLFDSPIEEYDELLVLDVAEGPASPGGEEFDRKVVLFMLAVCDVVIVTMKDQTNDGISKTLEGCAKALTSLHNPKVPQPIVFFVQNQKPNQHIPQQTQIEVIANLTQEGLNDVLSFSTESFVALPAAFLSKDIPITAADRWQKLITLPKFVERVAAFTNSMFAKVKQRLEDFTSRAITMPFSDLPTWLKFAHSTFQTICKFDGLTRFGDLLEEKQDLFVKRWLQVVGDSVGSTEKKSNIFALPDCITAIETYFAVVFDTSQRELLDMLEKNHIKKTLHKIHLDNLKVLTENGRANWIVEANVRITNERLQNEFSNGYYRINDKIREILRSGRKLSREQVNAIFEACFAESIDEILKQNAQVEASIKTLCLSIINIYKLFCTDLPNSEDLSEISIDQDPEDKLQKILDQLDASNYEDMTFRLPALSTVDPRIISGTGWAFIKGASIAAMKDELVDYLNEAQENSDVPDHIITSTFADKPVSEKITGTVSKWWVVAKCAIATRPYPNNLSQSKLAQLLVRAIQKELRRSPQLIVRLVHITLPLSMVRSKAQEVQLQGRLPTTEVIHRCMTHVNEAIIAPLDAELRSFGLALTKSMRSRLHLLMLQYLVAYNLRYYSKLLETPVVADLKDSWKATFVEQTLRGPARDVDSLEALVAKFDDSLQPYCLESARSIFAAALTNFQKGSSRFQLQLQFERSLASKSKEELLRYVMNPASAMKQHFDTEWQREEAKVFEQVQQIYTTEGNNLQPLECWTHDVHKQIEAAKFSLANDIFRASGGVGAVPALLAKEKATVLFYWDLLRGRQNTLYTIDGTELAVVEWNVPSSGDAAKSVKNLELLIKLVVSVGTISDLLTFSQRVAERVSHVGNALRTYQCTTAQLDLSNRLALAREQAAGCNQLCPCCRRCCDEEHWRLMNAVGTGPNRHKCRLGHQYRGMAGFAFEKTKFASLKACGDMSDDDLVWLNDRYVLWREFKTKFPSWDFHYPVHIEKGLDNSRKRMSFIWKQVGPELCDEYDIQFTASDQSYQERTKHFIFLVGATSSMEDNWHYFLRAGQKFADTKLAQDPSVSHLASLALFSHHTTKLFPVFRDCVLTPELFETETHSHLPFAGDKTSFSVALRFLYEILEKEASRIPTVVILLSDGDDSFPQAELHELCDDSIRKRIESFWTVGFGAKGAQGALVGIAQWMEKGERPHFLNPRDYSELVDYFGEIAQET